MEESDIQGKISDLEAKLEKMASETTDEEEQQKQKDLYIELGDAYLEGNMPEKAIQLYEDLLAKPQETLYATAYYELGKITLDQDDYQTTHTHFKNAIEWAKKTNDENTAAKAHHAYAYLLLQLDGNTPQKEEAFLSHIHEAILLFRKHKKYENLGKTFMVLTGFTQAHYGISEAIGYYAQLLEDTEAKEESELLGFIHYQLGMYYESDENPEASFRHFEQALHYKSKHGISVDLGETYYHLGLLYDERGNPEKAFEYNVIALRHMLQMTEMSTHIGMAVIFVQSGMTDCDNEALKQEAQALLEEAQKRDLMPEEEEEESSEVYDYDAPQIVEVLEQTREDMEKAEGLALEDLKKAYEEQKTALPENAETFAETAYNLLAKLEEGIDRSVFSFLARKKNKARKSALEEVLKETKTSLQNLLKNPEDSTHSLEPWLEKLEKDFEE